MINARRAESGQILTWVVVSAGILALFVATLFFMVIHESRWSKMQKDTSISFQMAEAALTRGLWKLEENTNYWTDLASAPIAGYNNDVVYVDPDHPTWKYRVILTTTSNSTERKIVGTGGVLKPGTTEPSSLRAIEAIYVKNTVVGAIHGPEVEIEGTANVHWGPVMATKKLELEGASAVEYPRHFSGQEVDPWDTDPTPPNWDVIPAGHAGHGGKTGDAFAGSWHSYNDWPVPQPPALDLNWYAQKAKDEEAAEGGAGKSPHYFAGAPTFANVRDDLGTPAGKSALPNKDHYRYFMDTLQITGTTFLRGYLICQKDVKMLGNGGGVYTAGADGYAKPPLTAWREYVVEAPKGAPGDTAASNEYPADKGFQTVNATFQFGSKGKIALGDGTNDQVTIYGFLYATDESELEPTGTSVIHGAINVHPKAEELEIEPKGNCTVYFRDDIDIRTTGSGLMRSSWRELLPQTFSYW